MQKQLFLNNSIDSDLLSIFSFLYTFVYKIKQLPHIFNPIKTALANNLNPFSIRIDLVLKTLYLASPFGINIFNLVKNRKKNMARFIPRVPRTPQLTKNDGKLFRQMNG